jgi:N-acetylglutamate synthase-like GNAT family acetyltransferase
MLIRSAVIGDVPALVGLLAAWGHEQDATGIEAQLVMWSRTEMADLLVADMDGKAVAAIAVAALPHLGRPGRLGRVMGLVVGDECRRQGVGRALIAAAEQRARAWDCDALELTSSRHRREAPDFYAALGFVDRSDSHARYVRAIV